MESAELDCDEEDVELDELDALLLDEVDVVDDVDVEVVVELDVDVELDDPVVEPEEEADDVELLDELVVVPEEVALLLADEEELLPDEPALGGVDGAGGAVTDVVVTTGLEELPAVVAVDPYSRAPISHTAPRS